MYYTVYDHTFLNTNLSFVH